LIIDFAFCLGALALELFFGYDVIFLVDVADHMSLVAFHLLIIIIVLSFGVLGFWGFGE
jgi:hypothetical protein